jgi:hypothetical protein
LRQNFIRNFCQIFFRNFLQNFLIWNFRQNFIRNFSKNFPNFSSKQNFLIQNFVKILFEFSSKFLSKISRKFFPLIFFVSFPYQKLLDANTFC